MGLQNADDAKSGVGTELVFYVNGKKVSYFQNIVLTMIMYNL